MQASVTFKLAGGNQVGIIVIAPVKEDYYRGFLGPDNRELTQGAFKERRPLNVNVFLFLIWINATGLELLSCLCRHPYRDTKKCKSSA